MKVGQFFERFLGLMARNRFAHTFWYGRLVFRFRCFIRAAIAGQHRMHQEGSKW
jgi:hypothetical protein